MLLDCASCCGKLWGLRRQGPVSFPPPIPAEYESPSAAYLSGFDGVPVRSVEVGAGVGAALVVGGSVGP
jgi:hypothetical protein